MSIYDKIKEAQVSKSGQYFKPGNYAVRIKACKLVKSQAGPAKTFFVIECEVRQSDNPDIPVGSERSQVIDMGKVMALPNIKQFMAAVSGIDPTCETVNEDVEAFWQKELVRRELIDENDHVPFEDVCELVTDEKINLLKDIEMKLECTNIQTKEKGQDFTKHNWQIRQI
jgi:hypothetical protein